MFSILSYLKFAKKIGHFRRFFLGPFFAILTKQRTAAAILLIAWQNEEKCFQKHVSLIFFPDGKAGKNMKKCFRVAKLGNIGDTDVSGNMFPRFARPLLSTYDRTDSE